MPEELTPKENLRRHRAFSKRSLELHRASIREIEIIKNVDEQAIALSLPAWKATCTHLRR
jgi:hypothetical protein